MRTLPAMEEAPLLKDLLRAQRDGVLRITQKQMHGRLVELGAIGRQGTVSKWENGELPGKWQLPLIADAYELPPEVVIEAYHRSDDEDTRRVIESRAVVRALMDALSVNPTPSKPLKPSKIPPKPPPPKDTEFRKWMQSRGR